MTALLSSLNSMDKSERPGAVVFSCLTDKNPEALAKLLNTALKSTPIFVPTISDNPRAAQSEDLARLLGPSSRPMSGLQAALDAAAEAAGKRPILVCGSLYLLSELYRCYPALLDPPSRKKEKTIFSSMVL
jgi:dihydrofolate synthase/folylpolyglutamate synthase